MLQDLRFTLRLILKDRWFSAAAVVALALGIGINAVGFSIVYAAFFRGLPFDNADRLFMLTWQTNRQGRRRCRTRSCGIGAKRVGLSTASVPPATASMNVSDAARCPSRHAEPGSPPMCSACSVSRQLLGRDFSPADEQKGAEPVAIISYTFWKNRYGGDANVLGTPIRVDGEPATIVGVMPEDMRFPDNTEVWMPDIPDAVREKRDARSRSMSSAC